MAESFGSFLADGLRRQGLTVRAYASLAGYPTGHSFVSRVLHGKLAPPLKKLDLWAAPLRLTTEERRRFDLLAAVAHAPPVLKAWFADNDKQPTRRRPRRRAQPIRRRREPPSE